MPMIAAISAARVPIANRRNALSPPKSGRQQHEDPAIPFHHGRAGVRHRLRRVSGDAVRAFSIRRRMASGRVGLSDCSEDHASSLASGSG